MNVAAPWKWSDPRFYANRGHPRRRWTMPDGNPAARVLDRMGLEHDPIPQWTGGGRTPPGA